MICNTCKHCDQDFMPLCDKKHSIATIMWENINECVDFEPTTQEHE